MKRNGMRILSILLAFVIVFANCVTGDMTVSAAAKSPTKITLNYKKKSMSVGDTVTLKVNAVKPAKASKSVTWKSSNKKVATVSSKGKVKAKKAGTVTITAKSKVNEKVIAKCKIKVYKATKKLKLTCEKSYTLEVGEKQKLSAKVTNPKKGAAPVTWSSKNKKIAKVDAKGNVTALSEGKTTIIGKSGKKNVTVTITVKKVVEVMPETPTPETPTPETPTPETPTPETPTPEEPETPTPTPEEPETPTPEEPETPTPTPEEPETPTPEEPETPTPEEPETPTPEEPETPTPETPTPEEPEEPETYTGKWQGMDWTIDENGELVISGTYLKNSLEGSAGWLSYRTKIRSVVITAENVKSTADWLSDCSYLTSVNVVHFDGSKITDMSGMFSGCSGLIDLDLSSLDASRVTNMKGMLEGCEKLISIYVPLNVTSECELPEGVWTDSAGTIHSVLPMGITGSFEIIKESEDYTYFGRWHGMSWAIDGNGELVIGGTYQENSTEEGSPNWLDYADDIKTATVTANNVKSTSQWFYNCEMLTSVDVSGFDSSQVTDMSGMFSGCSGLTNLDLSSLDASQVTNMEGMLEGCENLTSIYVPLNVTCECELPEGVWKDSAGTIYSVLPMGETERFEIINESEKYTYFGKWHGMRWGIDENDSLVIGGTYQESSTEEGSPNWLDYADNITTATVTANNVKSTSQWFYNCELLSGVDVSGFDSSQVTDMSEMFAGCSWLPELDLSSLDASRVTNMEAMLEGCEKLTSIYVPLNITCEYELPEGIWKDSVGTIHSVLPMGITERFEIINESEKYTYFGKWHGMRWAIDENDSLVIGGTYQESSTDEGSPNWLDYADNIKTATVTANNVKSTSQWFYNCELLSGVDVSGFESSQVTDMSEMFAGCSWLPNLDLSSLDVSRVTNMKNMFEGCKNLTSIYVPLNVTCECELFEDTWKDASKTKYTYLPTRVAKSFEITREIPILYSGTWTGMKWTINENGELVISGDCVEGKESQSPPWSEYGSEVKKVTVTAKNVISTYCWFENFYYLIMVDLSNFDTSQVTEMDKMFDDCISLTSVDLSNFDTSQVTSMAHMFWNCDNLTSLDLSSFDTSQVEYMDGMFSGCSSLTSLDLSSFDTSQVEYMDYMFDDCDSLTSLDLSNFDTSQVISMEYMFRICDNLTSLDLSNFDTSQVKSMTSMFAGCISLPSLDLSSFDTSQVKRMTSMFANCTSLTSLDLSNFDTSKVIYMKSMFANCISLTSLDLSNFNMSQVTDATDMFLGCDNLTSINVPLNVTCEVALPEGTWTDEAGNIYEYLPMNVTESFEITKVVEE